MRNDDDERMRKLKGLGPDEPWPEDTGDPKLVAYTESFEGVQKMWDAFDLHMSYVPDYKKKIVAEEILDLLRLELNNLHRKASKDS